MPYPSILNFGLKENPLNESVFVLSFNDESNMPPPSNNFFLLSDGTDFLLSDGTNLLLS